MESTYTVVQSAEGAEVRGLRSHQWAAAYLDTSASTLHYWLQSGIGPKSYLVGRHRKYRVEDLDAWIEERATTPKASA